MQGGESIRVIFGMKVRRFREQLGYSAKKFAALAGLSTSYLTEIEKGKKYPKADKIMQLAQILGISYDDLVSLKLGQDLNPLTALLDSPLLQEFPFQLFGLSPHHIIDLMVRSPPEASSLLHTLGEIASSYDVRVEHVLYAALRSYQETHHNYFAELESAAHTFLAAQDWEATLPLTPDHLRHVLTHDYGYVLDETTLATYPELRGLRSVWVPGPPPRLLLNSTLLPAQKAFVLGREIGYHYLKLSERAPTSSPIDVHSFAQVLNDFKASYFSGALLMPRDTLVADLQAFFQRPQWDGAAFLTMMQPYAVTPEMFLYRLSELMPQFFQLPQLHFLRVQTQAGSHRYRLTKHLNMSRLRIPHGIGLHEHYCRRWLSVHILRTLEERQHQGPLQMPIVGVQRSRFLDSADEYFCIALARPLVLTPGVLTSVTLGFALDEACQQTIRFWDDPAIPQTEINETCERCRLSAAACRDRAVPPRIYDDEQARAARKQVLAQLMTTLQRA